MDKKRLAARILKVGKSRVWFNPEHKKEMEDAITAQDFRVLIKKGIIKKLPAKTQLSIRKGKRKGKGRRKGAKYSRLDKKTRWVIKIRALRKELKRLKENSLIDKDVYKDLYRKAGGGFFRDKSHLRIYLERNELIKKG